MLSRAVVRVTLLTIMVVSVLGACTAVPTTAETKVPEKFIALCAPCHGSAGDGNGPAAAAMDPKPRNFIDGKVMNGRTDAQLMNVIKNGGQVEKFSPFMIAFAGQLSDSEIKEMIAYIRSLAVPKYQPK